MQSKLLADEYLAVASEFVGRDQVEAIRCVSCALQLDEEALSKARKTLKKSLGSTPPNGADESAADLRRLRRRQEKLDTLCSQEQQIVNSVTAVVEQPPPADPSGAPAACKDGPSREFLSRLASLAKLLEENQESKYDSARGKIREILAAHGGAGSLPPDSDVDTNCEYESWRMSIEHLLHDAGNNSYREGRHEEAITLYELSSEINPQMLEPQFNRALAAIRCLRLDTAAESINNVIQQMPHSAEAYYIRALVFAKQGHDRKSLDDLDQALDLDKDFEKARTYRQKLLQKMAGMPSGSADNGATDDGHSTSSSGNRASDDGHITDFTPYVTRPQYTLDDTGGHHRIKRILQKILLYLKGDPALRDWGAELPRGVLMHGAPGVGKTHLARCLAGEANVPFYAPPSSLFANVWSGSQEKSLRRLFEQASAHEGAIILVDEFDSIGSVRLAAGLPESWHNRIVNCLLELMDGLEERNSNLVVIASTNKFENVSKAFLRPGRFSYIVKVDRPNATDLAAIWLIHLDRCDHRASRLEVLAPELLQAVRANRSAWIEEAFRAGTAEPSGIVRLARKSHARRMHGDTVREIVRRVVDEKVMAQSERDWDLGPITPDDLKRGLDAYP
jgi:tetratricopeptide (TPR) repeat protein